VSSRVERGGEGSQVGNLCSAACGKVVARNLEIAEAERAGRVGGERGRRDGERNKKTRPGRATTERQGEERRGGGRWDMPKPRPREKRSEERGTLKRNGVVEGAAGRRGERKGALDGEMARWSLSVGTRATK